MRPPPFVTQQWEKLPGSVRSVIQEESRAVGRELRTVRRPRDLRRFARDPDAVGRIAVPLEPALDRIAALVAKGTVPIHPTVAGGVVAATGAASAGVSSALQLLALLGIEAPPAAVSVAGAAGAVAVASELVEFYLIACVARDELRRADRDDPALLRQVLIETYLGHDPPGPAPSDESPGRPGAGPCPAWPR
ncbi:MAG: hypothetical protein ACRDXE_01380 [Acidimicrobiales bacterium]